MLKPRIPKLIVPSTSIARHLHTRLHTFYSPTPESLSTHLSTIPAESTTLYLLSTSLPNLPELSDVLRSPNTLGSFQTSPTPCISIASFMPEPGEEIRIFRSELVGRPDPEVGRWQRLGSKRAEDERGLEGSLGDEVSHRGWEGVWEEGKRDERVEGLEGFE